MTGVVQLSSFLSTALTVQVMIVHYLLAQILALGFVVRNIKVLLAGIVLFFCSCEKMEY